MKNTKSRNPFLFRGPIPTVEVLKMALPEFDREVAIPSYSEVLFLPGSPVPEATQAQLVAIPSYSEVLFLQKHNLLQDLCDS